MHCAAKNLLYATLSHCITRIVMTLAKKYRNACSSAKRFLFLKSSKINCCYYRLEAFIYNTTKIFRLGMKIVTTLTTLTTLTVGI